MGIATTILLALAFGGQGPATSEPVARQRTGSRPDAAAAASDTAALRQSIDALTRQVVLLRQQFADQQSNDMRRFNTNVARLQLVLADLDRMKKERADLQQRLYVVQALQDDANDRLANIQRELITSGELNRSAGEDRLRATYNRQLAAAQTEANDLQQAIGVLDERIQRSDRLAETLRKRLKIDDSQIDVVDEPTPARPSTDEAPPAPQEE